MALIEETKFSLLIHSAYFPPKISGIAITAEMLARGLAARGVDVTVVTKTEAGQRESPHEYLTVRRPSFRQLRRLVQQSDCIHMEGFSFRCFALAKINRKPILWEHFAYDTVSVGYAAQRQDALAVLRFFVTQFGPFLGFMYWGNWILLRLAVNQVDRHVVRSKALLAPLPTARTQLIRWGVDLDVYRPSDSIGDYFLFAGRLKSGKGEEILLEAWHWIAKTRDPPSLKLVGPTPIATWPQSKITELDIDEHVAYLGPKSRDEVRNLIQGSYAVVIPSVVEEAGSTVAIEAMACGRPVIASRIGGLKELPSEATGFVELADPRELANQVMWLHRNPEAAMKMGASARAWAQESSDFERTIEEYIALYRSLASSARRESD